MNFYDYLIVIKEGEYERTSKQSPRVRIGHNVKGKYISSVLKEIYQNKNKIKGETKEKIKVQYEQLLEKFIAEVKKGKEIIEALPGVSVYLKQKTFSQILGVPKKSTIYEIDKEKKIGEEVPYSKPYVLMIDDRVKDKVLNLFIKDFKEKRTDKFFNNLYVEGETGYLTKFDMENEGEIPSVSFDMFNEEFKIEGGEEKETENIFLGSLKDKEEEILFELSTDTDETEEPLNLFEEMGDIKPKEEPENKRRNTNFLDRDDIEEFKLRSLEDTFQKVPESEILRTIRAHNMECLKMGSFKILDKPQNYEAGDLFKGNTTYIIFPLYHVDDGKNYEKNIIDDRVSPNVMNAAYAFYSDLMKVRFKKNKYVDRDLQMVIVDDNYEDIKPVQDSNKNSISQAALPTNQIQAAGVGLTKKDMKKAFKKYLKKHQKKNLADFD